MAVYFIQNVDTGHIKIGKSFNVKTRLLALSRKESAPLELLGVIEGYSQEEKDIHLYFDAIRFEGEWFYSERALLDFIEKHTTPLDELLEEIPVPDMFLMSKIKDLAQNQDIKNVQQFALKAGLPWSMARNIWTGDLSNRTLKTLVKATKALDCKLEDLYEVS